MPTNTCEQSGPCYVYVILVDGNISKEGYFEEEDKPEAERQLKKYTKNYQATLKRIRSFRTT